MNRITQTDRWGTDWTRIDKRTARRLIETGEYCILICPVNFRLWSAWQVEARITKSDLDHRGITFDEYVNRYEFYNCCAELGRYAAFYVWQKF